MVFKPCELLFIIKVLVPLAPAIILKPAEEAVEWWTEQDGQQHKYECQFFPADGEDGLAG